MIEIEMVRMIDDERDRFVDEFDNLFEIFHLVWFTKHDRMTFESSSSSTSDTVDI
jgi:hypothetical protein